MSIPAQQLALLAPTPRNQCVFSQCRRYRYSLRRVVQSPEVGTRGVCLWVLANPSIADETKLDPTLKKCAAFTTSWGYSEMRVVNVRAWVSTDPDAVPVDPEAIGPDNFEHIVRNSREANLVVCGWGKLGGELGRNVLGLLLECGLRPQALRLNQDGSPQHPLYLPYILKPFPLEAA